jgi:putative nucleotidyltransferase with HDIG domain
LELNGNSQRIGARPLIQTSFTGTSSTSNPRVYDFSAPVDIQQLGPEASLFAALVGSAAFRRLNEIRFLGGIDYLIVRSPNGAPNNIRYTRYQHSVGVARLALMYGRACELALSDRRVILAAALLHDIGHAPLSHSLEPAFLELFGIDHHQATRDIIRGHVPIGRELYKLLREHQVDVDRLTSIIEGDDGGFHGFFSGPINFDTIEGILRSKNYAQSTPTAVFPELIVDAAVNRASRAHKDLVDSFWASKDFVYKYVINSKSGVLADYVCQVFLRKNFSDVRVDDYFTTEEQLFKKLPGLRLLLTSPNFASSVAVHVPERISFKKRRFFVDDDASFFERNDLARYRQTKEEATLMVSPNKPRPESSHIGDFFDDESD